MKTIQSITLALLLGLATVVFASSTTDCCEAGASCCTGQACCTE